MDCSCMAESRHLYEYRCLATKSLKYKKIKLLLQQAVEANGIVRRRDSQTF